MTAPHRCRALVLTFGPPHGDPWWWQHVEFRGLGSDVVYDRVSIGTKRSSEVSLPELVWVLARIAWRLLRNGRRYDYLFTFECDLTSFAVALIQSLTFWRRPRHVILQFIMREKQPTLSSRLKYFFLRLCFASVYRVVCSSRPECDYYREVFGWPREKTIFVPFHTDPSWLQQPTRTESDFIIAAGRSLRDYATLLKAVDGLNTRVVIVAGRDFAGQHRLPHNVELRCDIPLAELNELMGRARLVVLPLAERRISTGQSILLQAMTLGKAVVATRTAGTVDYISHLENGMLVAPGDPADMRRAIEQLLRDDTLRQRLAQAGLSAVRERYLPQQYVENVANALRRLDS